MKFKVSFSWAAVVLGCLGTLSQARAVLADNADRSVAAYDVGPQIRPSWMNSQYAFAPNTSYLVNTQTNDTNFQTDIFGGTKNIAGMQQRYDDRTRDYGLRSQYGLADAWENEAYTQSMTGFGSDTSRDLQRMARTVQQQDLAQSVRGADGRGDLSQPVKVTSAVTAIASGNAVNFNLTDQTKVSTTTDFVHQHGQVVMTSPVVNFNASMDARNTSDPVLAAQTNSERYSVSFSKPLGVLDLNSALTYGGTTNCMRAAISRPIIPHVVGEFDSVKGNDTSGVPTEQSVRLGYGLAF